MRRFGLYLAILVLTILGIGFYGCSKSPNPPPSNTSTDGGSPTEHDGHNHGQHQHGEHDKNDSGHTGMETMKKGLARLSDSDRASALKQHICPVSGEMLGTMGEPIKVSVNGHEVWICCSGCKEDLLADPDK